MSDYISRQAAIDTLNGEFTVTGRENAKTIQNYIKGVDKKLRELPSAERHGRWLTTDAYPHKVYCSNCYGTYALDHWGIWIDESLPRNYCPNCGAKMDEVGE